MTCFNCVWTLGIFKGNSWVSCFWKRIFALLWELRTENGILWMDLGLTKKIV
jgi:hypothetical protein